MKKKIILSFLYVFLLASIGLTAVYGLSSNTNDVLRTVVKLHKIETLRQNLIVAVQSVQAHIGTADASYTVTPDVLSADISVLESTAQICTTCHHPQAIAKKIASILDLIGNYEKALNGYAALSGKPRQADLFKRNALKIGNQLLIETENMSLTASQKLNTTTLTALNRVEYITKIMLFTLIAVLLLAAIVGMKFYEYASRPILALLEGIRRVAAGDYGYVLNYPDKTEFGMLAHGFDEMSLTLNASFVTLQEEMRDRRASEVALRESEERYALIVNGSNDGIWDWNLVDNTIYLSARWKDILGYGANELDNKPDTWLGMIHPDDRSEFEVKIAAHIKGDSANFEYQYRMRHRDGTCRWVLTKGVAVGDDTGVAYRMAGSQTDVTENKTATDQLVHNAFHDELTGLPNRSLFMDRLQHVIAASTRRSWPHYAVMFLDLDRFKVINDSLGHLTGDMLLIAVGQKLCECVREGDTVARLGGDEFAILLEDIHDQNGAIVIAERIHCALSEPFMIEGHQIYTAGSIGIAFGDQSYDLAEQVLRDADIAMYEAKSKRNSSSEIYNGSMHACIIQRIKIEGELHRALDQGELTLVYQPIINVSTRQLAGFEALVRWQHPTRGTVSPVEFIPIAEETGMIVRIGEWILREACRELGRLQQRYPAHPPLKMSVNISGKQFAHENLADLVADALCQAEVAPRCLAIEITETMLMENIEVAIITMNRLRDMGVHIHIDDFGTGYSSLSYLHSLPIDALKIDRSFVKELDAAGGNNEIISSILSLARSLKLKVIAEGVELDHQFDHLEKMECEFCQGFLFSKPLEPGLIDAWLQASTVEVGMVGLPLT